MNTAAVTVSSCPAKTARGPPVSTFHVRAVLSRLAVSTESSLSPKRARRTWLPCSGMIDSVRPLRTFQTRAVPSLLAVTSRRERWLKLTSKMLVLSPWSLSVRSRSPNPLQTIASPSAPAVAIRSPFGLNAARCTRAGCGSTASTWPSTSITLAPRLPAMTNRPDCGPDAAKRVSPGTGMVATMFPRGRRRTVSVLPRTVSACPSESHVWAPRRGSRTTRPGVPPLTSRTPPRSVTAARTPPGSAARSLTGDPRSATVRTRDSRRARLSTSSVAGRRRQTRCVLRQQQPELRVSSELHDRIRFELAGFRGQGAGVRGERLFSRVGPLRQRPNGQRSRSRKRDERDGCDPRDAPVTEPRRRALPLKGPFSIVPGAPGEDGRCENVVEDLVPGWTPAPPGDAAKDARRIECGEHRLEPARILVGVAREIVHGVRDLRPRRRHEVVEETRDEIALAARRARQARARDAPRRSAPHRRARPASRRAARRSRLRARPPRAARARAGGTAPRRGAHACPRRRGRAPTAAARCARRDLLENGLDELVLGRHLGAAELGVRAKRALDRGARGRTSQVVEAQEVAEQARQAALERIEIAERVVADAEQDMDGQVRSRQNIFERTGERPSVAAVVEDVLLHLVEDQVELGRRWRSHVPRARRRAGYRSVPPRRRRPPGSGRRASCRRSPTSAASSSPPTAGTSVRSLRATPARRSELLPTPLGP